MPPQPNREAEPKLEIEIFGLLTTLEFQLVKCCAEVKHRKIIISI